MRTPLSAPTPDSRNVAVFLPSGAPCNSQAASKCRPILVACFPMALFGRNMQELQKNHQTTCPICMKSYGDMHEVCLLSQ